MRRGRTLGRTFECGMMECDPVVVVVVVVVIVVVVDVVISAGIVIIVVIACTAAIVSLLTGTVTAVMLFDWDVKILTGDVSAHANLTHSRVTTRKR